jgi:pilus assembly protein CpaB
VAVVAPKALDLLVATGNIEEGTELKPALFRKESRSSNEFDSTTIISNFDQLRGLYAKSFIAAGQPLVADYVTPQAPVNSVVPLIRDGYRAITLPLDKQTTNEGWARGGVRVDILFASQQGNTAQAAVIAQNVRVLSSGTSVSSEFGGESKLTQNGESTVTLEVSAEDQKRLKLAAGRGDLRLLLRGDEDTIELTERTKVPLNGIIVNTLGESAPAQPSDQGWVMIDGKRYRVVGNSLIPG